MRSHLIAACTLAALSAGAAAAQPCLFSAHQPANLMAMLDEGFDTQGLFYMPESFDALGEGSLAGGRAVFRGNEIVAHVRLDVDAIRDRQDLTVVDARGEWLLKSKLRVRTCGDALCKEISIKPKRESIGMGLPELEEGQGQDDLLPQDKTPFFMRWSYPSGYPLETYVYGRLVEPRVFQAALDDSFKWLGRALTLTDVTMPVMLTESVSKLQFALAMDELLRPYYELVKYSFTGNKVLITGKVPSNAHYGRAIDIVREQGFVVADVRLIIDGRLQLLPEPPRPIVCE